MLIAKAHYAVTEFVTRLNTELRFMLYWAFVFLIVALVAGVMGFGGIAGVATDMARVLFFIFLVLFVIGLALGWRAV
ncbi:MAG TPA: DUF1328 domain-containing protein [Candidatus Binataceae bacterium]|nr:DUF1328 domain-containing protein [Candidatus Binataceae bacterium]